MTDKRNEFIWNSWFQQKSNEKRVSQWKFFLRREWGYSVKGYRCAEIMNKKINDYIHQEICGNDGESIINIDGNSYSVDGYDHNTKTVYQFNGYCFHDCEFIDKSIKE